MSKELWSGNEALAEAAIRAGVEAFFGYPITPQTELLEAMARRMPELGRTFLQAESEIAAINMVYGAACCGTLAMTSTASPGFSLMQEGLSYIAGSEVPCLVVDMMRGGPGLGNIAPSQSDYFQVTRSAGHGDFHPLVLAPATLQEAVDLTYLSFDLAFRYRQIVIIAVDGALGQMMEPVEMPPFKTLTTIAGPTIAGPAIAGGAAGHIGANTDKMPPARPDWALTGAAQRAPRTITSLQLIPERLEELNQRLQAKLTAIQAAETRCELFRCDDAEVLIVAFGTVGRIAKSAIAQARSAGLKIGLLRPITLWPYPEAVLAALATKVRTLLVVEMNAGQMLEDVQRIVAGQAPVHFLGRTGGMIPLPDDILQEIDRCCHS
jgi:2-oxoglutarate ferredoxin oxidoreductase subunit alpha